MARKQLHVRCEIRHLALAVASLALTADHDGNFRSLNSRTSSVIPLGSVTEGEKLVPPD
jgi:hypothetical protein